MPWRRDHHAAANSNGRLTAQRTTAITTAVTIPAFTGPSPSERTNLGPRRTSTSSTARLVRVPRTHWSSKNRSKRMPAATARAPNTSRASSAGACRSAGTLVRQRKTAATIQAATPAPAAKVAGRTMRVAVISDVHANYHALEAVLGEIDAAQVDAVWCLGDTVGYGPRPNDCCEAVERRADRCLVGNHDLVVLGELTVSDFTEDAAAAALWTSQVLTQTSRTFLEGLKPLAEVEGVDLFHASARDPVWEYVLTEEAARATLQLSDASLVLVGHSHVALALTLNGESVGGGLAPAGTEVELTGRWLLNPGSVGQPRDGDARAAWLLLDLERGLPRVLAARLERGE